MEKKRRSAVMKAFKSNTGMKLITTAKQLELGLVCACINTLIRSRTKKRPSSVNMPLLARIDCDMDLTDCLTLLIWSSKLYRAQVIVLQLKQLQ